MMFSLLLIKILMLVRKRKGIKQIKNTDDFLLRFGLPDLSCCCDCCIGIGAIFTKIFEGARNRHRERKFARQSAEIERKTAERQMKEQEQHLARLEIEKIEREEKVKKLRASGFEVTTRRKNKILETVNLSSEINTTWLSKSLSIPIEEIVLVVEDHPDFELKDEYILNKKKIEAKVNICPNCENVFEENSKFCPNCGHALK